MIIAGLDMSGMGDCKPARLPMLDGLDCMEGQLLGQGDSTTYKELLGSLIYVAVNTRPDIKYVVSTLSKHMATPGAQYLAAAKQLLRYLQCTKGLGITYGRDHSGLLGYVDSD
eukprot:366143-Chlamydomonas_euryale.AAC.4